MSDKRVGEMTDEEIQQLAGARPISYWQANRTDRTWLDARDRYHELTQRELLARARVTLVARGEYDPEKHGTEEHEPLTRREHLEVLANGEVVARVYRHPGNIDRAVKAGATWEQIAEAMGTSEDHVRQEYREFAEGQHRLSEHYEGRFGMGDQEYREALARVEEAPGREAGS